jgi:hypothetical protein
MRLGLRELAILHQRIEFDGSWNMNENIAREILHELFSSLEALETQSMAILQFLKEKGIATDEDLAPHFEQAGNASSVRWLAAQARIDHLLSSAMKNAEQDTKQALPKAEENDNGANNKKEPRDSAEKLQEELQKEQPTEQSEGLEEIVPGGDLQAKAGTAGPEKGENRRSNESHANENNVLNKNKTQDKVDKDKADVKDAA